MPRKTTTETQRHRGCTQLTARWINEAASDAEKLRVRYRYYLAQTTKVSVFRFHRSFPSGANVQNWLCDSAIPNQASKTMPYLDCGSSQSYAGGRFPQT